MLLSECPEGLPYLVQFYGSQHARWRDGKSVRTAQLDGERVTKLSEVTNYPPDYYEVIKPLFRQDGDD